MYYTLKSRRIYNILAYLKKAGEMKRKILLMAFCLMMMGFSAQVTEKILIGASVALTGPYSHTGREQLNGYQMWVREINKIGGLQGRSVELIYYDDESQPDQAAQLYEKLITTDKVDLLFGPYTSTMTMAASTVAEKYGFPMISTGASAIEIWNRGYKNTFGLYTPANHYLGQILEFAQTQGLKKIALIYENTLFTQGLAKEVKNKAEQLKMNLIFEEEYSAGTTNFIPIMTNIKSKAPEIVIGGTSFSDSRALLRQTKESHLEAKLFIFTGNPGFSNSAQDSQSMIGHTQWEDTLNIPGAKEFTIRYQKIYGHRPGYPAAGGYGAGQVLAAAVREAHSLERNRLRQVLLNLKVITIFGPYQVDSTGEQIAKLDYATQWMKEERHPLLPKKVIFHNPVYLFSID